MRVPLVVVMSVELIRVLAVNFEPGVIVAWSVVVDEEDAAACSVGSDDVMGDVAPEAVV